MNYIDIIFCDEKGEHETSIIGFSSNPFKVNDEITLTCFPVESDKKSTIEHWTRLSNKYHDKKVRLFKEEKTLSLNSFNHMQIKYWLKIIE